MDRNGSGRDDAECGKADDQIIDRLPAAELFDLIIEIPHIADDQEVAQLASGKAFDA